jgi:hypothetical protein
LLRLKHLKHGVNYMLISKAIMSPLAWIVMLS